MHQVNLFELIGNQDESSFNLLIEELNHYNYQFQERNEYGQTLIHYAAAINNQDVLEHLLMQIADLPDRLRSILLLSDNQHQTPLQLAMRHGVDPVRIILRFVPNLSIFDQTILLEALRGPQSSDELRTLLHEYESQFLSQARIRSRFSGARPAYLNTINHSSSLWNEMGMPSPPARPKTPPMLKERASSSSPADASPALMSSPPFLSITKI